MVDCEKIQDKYPLNLLLVAFGCQTQNVYGAQNGQNPNRHKFRQIYKVCNFGSFVSMLPLSKQDKVQMRGACCIDVQYRNLEPLIIYKTNMRKQAGNKLTWPVCHFVFSKQIICLSCTSLLPTHFPKKPQVFLITPNLSKRQLVYCPLWSQRQFASNTTDLLSLEHPDVSQVQRGISGWYSSSCTPPQNKIRRTIHLDSFFLAKATMRP